MAALSAYLCALIAGYLIGSVSFAVLIARARGVDIFKVGSGNPGATNVLRVLGKPAGYGCFLLDAFKGVAAVLIGVGIARGFGAGTELTAIFGLSGAILGHSFSLFLGFKGGKGVATTVGGLLALMPYVMLIGLLVWLVVFYSTRYVSLASILLGLSLPVSAVLLGVGQASMVLCLLLAVLIVVRHRANIRRLLAGEENRASRTKR
jgi:glycerol-3-phosphate acyltransferase PlsY